MDRRSRSDTVLERENKGTLCLYMGRGSKQSLSHVDGERVLLPAVRRGVRADDRTPRALAAAARARVLMSEWGVRALSMKSGESSCPPSLCSVFICYRTMNVGDFIHGNEKVTGVYLRSTVICLQTPKPNLGH